MGTGKTYLVCELSRRLGWLYFSSDALRKQLAGLVPEERSYDAWSAGLCSAQAGEATYQSLFEGAEARLALGDSVVVDASFREERLARRQANGGSSSDGRPGLLDRQAVAWEDSSTLLAAHGLMVDGGGELEQKLDLVVGRLKELGHRV